MKKEKLSLYLKEMRTYKNSTIRVIVYKALKIIQSVFTRKKDDK